MEIHDYTLEKIIKECYPHIQYLNPAQKAVLESGYMEAEDNYIIAIPTASGKTLLGVMAALKALLNHGKVIYAVPLISIQNEKLKEFKSLEEQGFRVGRHPHSSDLAVMVFESFDSLTRFYWNNLREVDLLIVDEFHMIGDYSRGPTIECAITRSHIINPSLRIIALSATLRNMEEIAGWLNAQVVEHNYRPVPLHKEVLNTEMFNTKNKNEVIVKIMEKGLKENSQILTFVSTRRFTEALAKFVADKIENKLPKTKKKVFQEVARKILKVPEKKGSRPTNICLKLADSVKNGVAFHHAGLFSEQKEIIEDEFRSGNLIMITATPSLMYGVNLPSRSVVIRDYTRWTFQGPQKIPVFDYEQMSGRAGRPQYDDVGYSYLIAKTLDEAYDLQELYVNGEIESTNSKLIENKDAVYRQIIAQIASQMAKNPVEIQEFFAETFYGHQMQNNPYMNTFAAESLEYEINTALDFLMQNGILQATPEGLKTTELGLLIAKSNYTVETAIKFKEFASTMDELDIYQLIYQLSHSPDLPLISFKGRKSREPIREKLSSKGIFAMDMQNPEATAASLMEWIEERNEYEIENAFHVYAASTRRSAYEASKLLKFFRDICQVLGIYNPIQEINILSARFYYGVKEELIPLVLGVKRLGRKRARALFNRFGEDLRPFTEKELQKVDGIGPKLAAAIRKYAEN